jgi:glycosyltransferase involved in cell wall biosynthesis
MRVLLVTPFYPPLQGGAATYSSIITNYFRDRHDLERLFVLTEQVSGVPRVEHQGRVTVMRYLAPRDSRPIMNSGFRRLTSLWGLLQISVLVRRLRIDLIHWHGSAVIWIREIFSRQIKLCPVLLDIRDTLAPTSRLVGCDHYIASSGNTLEYMLRGGIPAHLITYIPIPFIVPISPTTAEIRAVQRQYGLEENKDYLLFVGALTEQKGILELLEGFKLFSNGRMGDINLVLAGPDRTGGQFAGLIGKSQTVHYLGRVPRNDVLALMRGARSVVLPAKGEALGRTILEAVALGIPVICPPNIPEFIDHCPDFVLSEVSPQMIATKLREVLERGIIPKYPFELHDSHKCLQQLMKVYQYLVNNYREK